MENAAYWAMGLMCFTGGLNLASFAYNWARRDEISRSRLLKKLEDMKLKSEGYTAMAWDSCIDSVKSVIRDM
ncbi:hypothetical protein [uncultured Parasutterella sp.]|uniref:hypothetical protein n=1 Tax=uncultured Parasutterella sp. TaxID=1263098 RepID=UPI00272B0C22|nr:hypothetical protein [uncultured Parasutterella sp.]